MHRYEEAWRRERILLVIPVYNEALFLSPVLETVLKLVPKDHILMINDGSTDATQAIINEYHLLCMNQVENAGKGSSILAGIRYAQSRQYKWIITMDGDGQHDPHHLPQFVAAIMQNNADLIIGKRQNKKNIMPWQRQVSNGLSSIMISLMIEHTRIHDSQCGYRALRLACIHPADLHEKGFQFESEILLLLGLKEKPIVEIPISTHYGQQHSKIHAVHDSLNFLALIVRYLWQSG